MTNKEKDFIKKTIDIWNLFLELKDMSNDNINDARKAIHILQYLVMKNETKRNNPDIFN